MRIAKPLLKIFVLSLVGLTIVGYPVYAYVASSTNYRIQSDSLNVGGLRQTSTNYISEDTIGEVGTGISTSTLYKLKAGYQPMQEIYLAISPVGDVNLSPDIGGITGGFGTGTTTVTVTTDDPAGYSLTLKASTTPALKSGSYSFADFAPNATTVPQFAWSIDPATSVFGYTVEGSDIYQFFKDNGSVCDAGSSDSAYRCWLNASTTGQTIAWRNSSAIGGTNTTLGFKAESGTSHVQESGIYSAKISVTATAL